MWDIKKAKKYYIVPFKEKESLFWLGDEKRLLAMEMVLDEKYYMGQAGVNTEVCYIILDMSNKQVDNLLVKVDKNIEDGQRTIEKN
jgi:hypothetical protein